MDYKNKKIKYISIEELIKKAKELGVDFGKGNPKNRLRYYTKIGLLPHAERKIFPGERLPKGAYPEYVLDLLVKIDKEIKKGKTVQDLKRQLEKGENGSLQNLREYATQTSESEKVQKLQSSEVRFLPKFPSAELLAKYSLTLFLLFLVTGITSFFVLAGYKSITKLPANIGKYLAQTQPENLQPESIPSESFQVFPAPPIEPYLTINAETKINGPLKVEDFIQTPRIKIISPQGITAQFDIQELTQSRNYIFPDQSGTICLNTGNCFGIFGEVTATDYQKGRIARFNQGRKIESSSIADLYNKGVAMIIDQEGRIGIGTERPDYKLDVIGDVKVSDKLYANQLYIKEKIGVGKENPEVALDVEGKIQATGDICTKLGGGKCLSELTEAVSQIPFIVSGSNLSGSGSSGYLALWSGNTSLTSSLIVQKNNNIGIGTNDPQEKLDVAGTIQVEGFKMPTGAQDGYVLMSDANGVGTWQELPSISLPQGSIGQTLRHDGNNWIANSFLYNAGDKIGIGTTNPSTELDVAGTIKMTGFQLTTGAQAGYVLTSDANGVGSWQPPPSGTLPSGTEAGQTLRWDGSNWLPNSFLFNTGSAVGIGTNSPSATLTVAGSGLFQNVLTISSTNLPQFVLQYDQNNYVNLSVNDTQTEFTASKLLIIDSLTGEIRMGNNVNLLNASNAVIQGQTFQSSADDSTVRKSGELVFRQAVPIFRFPMPAQTESTTFVRVSKYFEQALSTLPPVLPGAQRKYMFLINFADNIPTTDVSTWRVYQPNADQVVDTFTFLGQAQTSLEEGTPHLSPAIDLPTNDWQLEVEVPAGYKIRIFNIFLLVYDQIF